MGGGQSKNQTKNQDTATPDENESNSVSFQDADTEGSSVDLQPITNYVKTEPPEVLSGLPGEVEDIGDKDSIMSSTGETSYKTSNESVNSQAEKFVDETNNIVEKAQMTEATSSGLGVCLMEKLNNGKDKNNIIVGTHRKDDISLEEFDDDTNRALDNILMTDKILPINNRTQSETCDDDINKKLGKTTMTSDLANESEDIQLEKIVDKTYIADEKSSELDDETHSVEINRTIGKHSEGETNQVEKFDDDTNRNIDITEGLLHTSVKSHSEKLDDDTDKKGTISMIDENCNENNISLKENILNEIDENNRTFGTPNKDDTSQTEDFDDNANKITGEAKYVTEATPSEIDLNQAEKNNFDINKEESNNGTSVMNKTNTEANKMKQGQPTVKCFTKAVPNGTMFNKGTTNNFNDEIKHRQPENKCMKENETEEYKMTFDTEKTSDRCLKISQEMVKHQNSKNDNGQEKTVHQTYKEDVQNSGAFPTETIQTDINGLLIENVPFESTSTCYIDNDTMEEEFLASTTLTDQMQTRNDPKVPHVLDSSLRKGEVSLDTSLAPLTGKISTLDPNGLYRQRFTRATNDNRIRLLFENSIDEGDDDTIEQSSIYSNIMFLPDKCKGAFPKRYGPKRLGTRVPDTLETLSIEDEIVVNDERNIDSYDNDLRRKMEQIPTNEIDDSVDPPRNSETEDPRPEDSSLYFDDDHFGLYTGCIASGISKEFNVKGSSDTHYTYNNLLNTQNCDSFAKNTKCGITSRNKSLTDSVYNCVTNTDLNAREENVIHNDCLDNVKGSEYGENTGDVCEKEKMKEHLCPYEIDKCESCALNGDGVNDKKAICSHGHFGGKCVKYSNGSAVLKFCKSLGINVNWKELQSKQANYAIALNSFKTNIADDNRMVLKFDLPHFKGRLSERNVKNEINEKFGSKFRSLENHSDNLLKLEKSLSSSCDSCESYIVNDLDESSEESKMEETSLYPSSSTSLHEEEVVEQFIERNQSEHNLTNFGNQSRELTDNTTEKKFIRDIPKYESRTVIPETKTDSKEYINNLIQTFEECDHTSNEEAYFWSSIIDGHTTVCETIDSNGGFDLSLKRKKINKEEDNRDKCPCSANESDISEIVNVKSCQEREFSNQFKLLSMGNANKEVSAVGKAEQKADNCDITITDYCSFHKEMEDTSLKPQMNVIDRHEDFVKEILNHNENACSDSCVRDDEKGNSEEYADVVVIDVTTTNKTYIEFQSERLEDSSLKQTQPKPDEVIEVELSTYNTIALNQTDDGNAEDDDYIDIVEDKIFSGENEVDKEGEKKVEQYKFARREDKMEHFSEEKYRHLSLVLRSKKTCIDVDNRITSLGSIADSNAVFGNNKEDDPNDKEGHKSDNDDDQLQEQKSMNMMKMFEKQNLGSSFKTQYGNEEAEEAKSVETSELSSSPSSPSFASHIDLNDFGLDPFLKYFTEFSQQKQRHFDRNAIGRHARRSRQSKTTTSDIASSFYEDKSDQVVQSSTKDRNKTHEPNEKICKSTPNSDGEKNRGNVSDRTTSSIKGSSSDTTEKADNQESLEANKIITPGEGDTEAEDQAEDGAIYLEENVWQDIIESEVNKCFKESPLLSTTRCTIICLDISNSMKGNPWTQMMQAVTDFIQGLKDVKETKGVEDHLALVTFGHETKIAVPLTFDYDHVLETCVKLEPGGVSPMYPGIHLSLFPAFTIAHRRLFHSVFGFSMIGRVVLITDGHATHSRMIGDTDSASERKKEEITAEIMQLVKQLKGGNSINIFSVPIGVDANMVLLETISTISGGRVVNAGDIRQLAYSTYNHYIAVQVGRPLLQASPKKIDEHLFQSLVLALYPDSTASDVSEMLSIINHVHRLENRSKEEKTWSGSSSSSSSEAESSSNSNEEEDVHFERDGLPPFGTRVSKGPDPFKTTHLEDIAAAKGTVTGHSRKEKRKIFVHWDSGVKINCCYGQNDKFNAILEDTALPCVVTDPITIGCKVRRGPDWQFGDQDGGSDQLGSVFDVESKGVVWVRWPNGYHGNYRYRYDDVYDVTISDPEDPFGVKCYTKEMNRKNHSKTFDNFGRNEYKNRCLNIDLNSSIFGADFDFSVQKEAFHSGIESEQNVKTLNKNAALFINREMYTGPSQTGAIPKTHKVALHTC